MDTTGYLLSDCIVNNGFFHDISHSGINPYLTLHLAQVLMRIGELRFIDLVKNVAELASSTGQWPEAINPRTGLGCMGDGQHVWASAEWILMMINCFVMQQKEKLILGAGIFPDWLVNGNEISIGPIATFWGPVGVRLCYDDKYIIVEWEGNWRSDKPQIEVRLPGYESVVVDSDETSIKIERKMKI